MIIDGVIGALTGVLSGMGVGGGSLLMLYLTLCSGVGQRTAQGINLLYFIPTAGAALVGHIRNKLIEKTAFFWSAGFGAVTCLAASWFAGKLPVVVLRRGFGIFLLIVGIAELFRKAES